MQLAFDFTAQPPKGELVFVRHRWARRYILRVQDDVGIDGASAIPNASIAFGARVHARVIATLGLAVKQANNAVVLELFADGPHQNRAHLAPPSIWIPTVGNSEV